MTLALPTSLGSFIIPAPERSDPESVRSGLASARESFERGELREALRHLRHAAEDADTAGSELRAVAFARAAADLATEIGTLTPPPTETGPTLSVAPASAIRPQRDPVIEQLLGSGRAVKVVVKRSARDPRLYVVRKAEAQPPGLGAREAVLVLLDPDATFFDTAESGDGAADGK